MRACARACVHESYLHMYVCMHTYDTYVCMYVSYVCINVCMYVYIYHTLLSAQLWMQFCAVAQALPQVDAECVANYIRRTAKHHGQGSAEVFMCVCVCVCECVCVCV